MKTPLIDQESKIDMIEHINQDHTDQVLLVAQTYADCPTASSAILDDIFDEGLDIAVKFVNSKDEHAEKIVFAPFQIKGDAEEKMLYLMYTAMAKAGRSLSDSRRQFFTICNTEMLTTNLLRLTIDSETPLPENSPAYAYGFLLKILDKQPEIEATQDPKPKNIWQRTADSLLLWVMKILSSKNRKKMIKSMNKGLRYYTLQSAWKSTPECDFANRGYVDVFLHGNTAGSQWAESLKVGDIISSRVEHDDNHDNLHTDQALLIADETAYPALLGLLQQWQNPIAPYVIIVSEHESEQAYFNDSDLQGASQVQRITCPPNEQGKCVIKALSAFPNISTTWGAFEKDSAKAVRVHLRNELKIKGHDNRIKGYWALDMQEKKS